MLWVLAISFLCAAAMSLLIVASSSRHRKWSSDADLSGPQKFHAEAVLRIGGVGIAAGLLGGNAALVLMHRSSWHVLGLLCLCAAPTLFTGLVEDLTKAVPPRVRLFASALSGLLGALLLDATLGHTGWSAFDAVLAVPGIGLTLTIFTVAGVVNSFNIIDGLNGLASMIAMMAMGGLAYVAWQADDPMLAGLALSTVGAALGFFIWNYPRGLIFLGDSGAYVLGLAAVELGLAIIWRNREVSPIAPLTMFSYPVIETVFSMYRRRIVQGRPVSKPDGVHLHSLVYRRVARRCGTTAVGRARANSAASPCLWVLASLSVVPAAVWWDDTRMLLATMAIFACAYVRLYQLIVRFRTPAWIRFMVGRPRPEARQADADARATR